MDHLFGLIDGDTLYDRPIPERHRLIFYLGHVDAFDWNQICRGALGMQSFHPSFDSLFEFGIDPEPGSAPSDTPSDWPREHEVRAYVAKLRSRVDESLSAAPEQILDVAIEHRLMHCETFAYLLHELPHDRKRKDRSTLEPGGPSPENPFIDIPAGEATLGQRPGDFGWDNEFARHRVAVPGFRIAKYKVTNGDYLRFVQAGARAPHFWADREGSWHYRGMFDFVPLPLDSPVYVTHDEAVAYAEWAGKSLPSEAQFHRAAYGTPRGAERRYPWGDVEPRSGHGNFDGHGWDPEAVTAHPGGESAFGIAQLVGNGWEWTSTEFAPFAGFQPFPFYPGYSQNFFDGRHYVLKGGSPRTPRELLRPSFRNWFRPNYPYVYSTFRLLEND